MKYLKYQQEYKIENLKSDLESSEMINEVFENDITWGGSLLGRLLNSALRKMKVGYNFTKVNSIVKQVESELLALLEDHRMSENQKRKAGGLKARQLLTEIYNEVVSNKEIKEKLNTLLGNDATDGLIDKTIAEIQKVNLDNKEELIDKLNKFKDDLSKLRTEEPAKGEEEDEEGKEGAEGKLGEKSPIAVFYQNSKSLLQSVCKIHLDIKNNTVKFQKGATGDGEKTSTFFDENEYKQQTRTNTVEEINKKIEMAQSAIQTYTTKGNKERVNFYNKELQKYKSKLDTLQGASAKKDDNATSSTETRPFDADADKRAKELSSKMHAESILEEIDANLKDQEEHAKSAWNKVVNAYTTSGISKYIPHIESILNPNGVDKIKDSRKKIVEIGKQVIVNYDNVGKPISLGLTMSSKINESEQGPSLSDISKSISLLGKVLMAFTEDMGLLGSYGASYTKEKAAGGAGNHIKMYITSFNQMKEIYPSIKKVEPKKEEPKKEDPIKEFLMRYSDFIMLREADEVQPEKPAPEKPAAQPEAQEKAADQPEQPETPAQPEKPAAQPETPEEGDGVKKSWFKFFQKGDQKKWAVTEEDKKLRDEIEGEKDKKITLNDPANDDHIIKIVNYFGRAYKLYATDYIPSGRPGGRVSQKTLREYEYIGKGSPNQNASEQGIIPGYGPWAAKSVYEKWQNGITKLLEDKQLRVILANTNFVSEAESSTDTTQKTPGSGKTLMAFMNAMLDNNEGTFKKHREMIFRKYFGVEGGSKDKDMDSPDAPRINPDIAKDDEGATDSPFFTSQIAVQGGLSKLNKSFAKVISGDTVYIINPYKITKDGSVLFKYQVTSKNNPKQSIVSDFIGGKMTIVDKKKMKTDIITNTSQGGIPYEKGMETNIGYAKTKGNPFTINNEFKFSSISMSDAKSGKYSDIKDQTIKISSIEYLIVPTVFNDKGKRSQKNSVVSITKTDAKPSQYVIPQKNADELIKEFSKR